MAPKKSKKGDKGGGGGGGDAAATPAGDGSAAAAASEDAAAELDERWSAIVEAAQALTVTPPAFTASHVDRLRQVGLSDEAIGDLVSSAGFFSWANRLMLSLGEPENPPA